MGEDGNLRKKHSSNGLSSENGSDLSQDDALAATLHGDDIISFVIMYSSWCSLLVPNASGGVLQGEAS